MLITSAFAQASGAAAPGGAAAGLISFAPMVLLFVAFYFLLIRPQQRRAKALAAQIASVKKGDSVITAGGMVGKVTKVDEAFAEIEIATGVKVRVVKATIAEVTPPGGAKPAND